MIESGITLQIQSFQAMAEQCVAIMERMAAQAAGARISANLFVSVGPKAQAAGATTAAAMLSP